MARITTQLTNTEIKAAKPAAKDYTLQDGGGLYLLIKPNGSRIWRFNYYRPDNKKRALISFGAFPSVSLAEARQMREAAKALISKGIDPQAHQQRQREQEQAINLHTFAKVAADWYEVKKSQPLAENTIKRYLAFAGKIRVPVHRMPTDHPTYRPAIHHRVGTDTGQWQTRNRQTGKPAN